MGYAVFLGLIFLLGCSRDNEPKPAAPLSTAEELKGRADGWRDELGAASDAETGWPSVHDCDGTLWAGEAKAAGMPIHLEVAEYAPGEVHRRPKASGECYPVESGSTVSADMLAGYQLGSFAAQDRPALERLWSYGEAKGWVMGSPSPDTRTVMSPEGRGLLVRAVHALGGRGSSLWERTPETCIAGSRDYEQHIQVISIYLDGRVSGAISDVCTEDLKALAARNPNDALFAAVAGIYTGDESAATALLINPAYRCPSYVRPVPAYCLVHKLFAARIALKQLGI